jgi:hypothetical protein
MLNLIFDLFAVLSAMVMSTDMSQVDVNNFPFFLTYIRKIVINNSFCNDYPFICYP